MAGKIEMSLNDFPVHVLLILGVERDVSGRHLENQDSDRPPIHRFTVTAIPDHLLSKIWIKESPFTFVSENGF